MVGGSERAPCNTEVVKSVATTVNDTRRNLRKSPHREPFHSGDLAEPVRQWGWSDRQIRRWLRPEERRRLEAFEGFAWRSPR